MKLLSIIIPTKDRFKYLKTLINHISIIDDSRIEFIIQDNSTNNEDTYNYLKMFNNSNIKYFYDNIVRNISDNFTNAILNSSGKYICILGDDDIFSNEIVNLLDYIQYNDVDSIVFNKAIYKWDDVKYKKHRISILNINTPQLSIPKFTGKIKRIDPILELRKCILNGAKSLYKMPVVYHGIVSRKILDEVYSITGTYFPGPSPDMASAISLSLVTKNHLFIDLPIIISGHGYKSAGGSNQRREHIGSLENKPFLPKDIVVNWNKFIPMIWSGPTIYAETLEKTLKRMNAYHYWEKFNFEKNYSNLILMHPEQINLVKETIKLAHKSLLLFNYYRFKNFIFKLYRYILLYISKNIGITRNKYFKYIKDTHNASVIVSELIRNKKKDRIQNV